MSDEGLAYIKKNAKKVPKRSDRPVRMVDAIMALELTGMTERRARRIVERRYELDYGIAEIELPGKHCRVLPSEFTKAWNAGKLTLPAPREFVRGRSKING